MYLQANGAEVETRDDPDRARFRAEHGVPDQAGSCHTALVDGYVVEGHVPVGAIRRLLDDSPDAVGLTVPGMPADSPGMGGDVTTWEGQAVALITNGGELTEFDY